MLQSIVGLQNSGKTLYMTYLLFLDFLRGKKVVSNYDLAFPHMRVNKDWLVDVSKKQNVVFNNISIGFDELWVWMDSRQSIINSVSTYFFLQSSKDDTNIRATAQTNMQIDVRFRKNLHRISTCDRVFIKDGKEYQINTSDRILSDEMQKYLYIKVIEYKHVSHHIHNSMVQDKILYIKASNIFKLYNTRQKIFG